jgi:hypothetical protein
VLDYLQRHPFDLAEVPDPELHLYASNLAVDLAIWLETEGIRLVFKELGFTGLLRRYWAGR